MYGLQSVAVDNGIVPPVRLETVLDIHFACVVSERSICLCEVETRLALL